MLYDTIKTAILYHPGDLDNLEPLLDIIVKHPPDWLWRSLLGDQIVVECDSLEQGASHQPAGESDGQLFFECYSDKLVDLLRKSKVELDQLETDEAKD